jgi:hypothetical protein
MDKLVKEFLKVGSVQHLNAAILMLQEVTPGSSVITYMQVSDGVGTFRVGLEKDGKEIDTDALVVQPVLQALAPASAAVIANSKRVPIVFAGLPFEVAKELENKVFAIELFKKDPEAYWQTVPGKIRRLRSRWITTMSHISS